MHTLVLGPLRLSTGAHYARLPCHRTKAELQDIRAFKEAAAELAALPDAQLRYDLRLARFYMWAQTAATVYLACSVPTGGREGATDGWVGRSGAFVQGQRAVSAPLTCSCPAGLPSALRAWHSSCRLRPALLPLQATRTGSW